MKNLEKSQKTGDCSADMLARRVDAQPLRETHLARDNVETRHISRGARAETRRRTIRCDPERTFSDLTADLDDGVARPARDEPVDLVPWHPGCGPLPLARGEHLADRSALCLCPLAQSEHE